MVFWRLCEPFLDPIELRKTEDIYIQAITLISALADKLSNRIPYRTLYYRI